MALYQIVVIITVVQSFLIGLFLLKYLDNKLKLVLGFVSFAVFTELSNLIIIHVFRKTTIWIVHFYVMFEFLFWAVYYWYLLKPLLKRSLYLAILVLFEIYCIVNLIFIQNLYEYSVTRAVEGIILLLFSIVYFYKVMIDSELEKPLKEPSIWINSAVLFYFGGSVFHYLLFNVLLQIDATLLSKLNTYFFISLNLLFYLSLSLSFYLQKLKAEKT